MAKCTCAINTGGCGKVFKSLTGFDKHLVGKPIARRCLTDKELKKLGMIEKDGAWIASTMPFSVLMSRKLAK